MDVLERGSLPVALPCLRRPHGKPFTCAFIGLKFAQVRNSILVMGPDPLASRLRGISRANFARPFGQP